VLLPYFGFRSGGIQRCRLEFGLAQIAAGNWHYGLQQSVH